MPSKIDLSQFGLQQFRSYSRFDNGQEEKLRSALDHHFAIEGLPAPDPRLLKPRTVRLHHRRGVKVLSPNGLPVKCVDRTSRWGNPFEIGRDGTREEVTQKYRDWFSTGTEPKKVGRYTVDPRALRDHLHELRGFNLACCRPELPCHADFLLEQASQPEQSPQGPTET